MNKEQLMAELASGKRSARIARELGKSPQTILNWMKKWGIEKPQLSIKILTKRIFQEGKTKQEVANEFHLHVATVTKFINKHNLKLDVCRHCGNEFHAIRNTTKHCSLECLAWSQIDKRGSDECWNFIGTNLSNGYGRIWNGDGHTVAHLVIWKILNDDPPSPGEELRHQCGNRLCCNPNHLKTGSRSQNVADSKRDGTFKSPQEGVQKYKLTQEDHDIIKLLADKGWGCKKIQRVYFPLVAYQTIHRQMKKKT